MDGAVGPAVAGPGHRAIVPALPSRLRVGEEYNAIGAYNDFDALLSWIFLTSALTTGSEFVSPIGQAFASEMFLRGRILGQQSITTPAGTFADALACCCERHFVGMGTPLPRGTP